MFLRLADLRQRDTDADIEDRVRPTPDNVGWYALATDSVS